MKKKTIGKLLTALLLSGSMVISAALPAAQAANTPITDSAPTYQSGGNSQYPVLLDANGNVYDLGGMEIVVRDWWSIDGIEPSNEYEQAQKDYRDWLQQTYNFKIKSIAISDWGSAPRDFVNYVSSGGDGNNYVFTLRDDPAMASAMVNGLCYDLSTLSCLNFSEDKFARNLVHEKYSFGNHIFAMSGKASDPGVGIYFNKRLLAEAGFDPEGIYSWQNAGVWTWNQFEYLCNLVQRDVNNDDIIDVYACDCNDSELTNAAVFTAGGEYIGRDETGKFVNKLYDEKTQKGLAFAQRIFDNYFLKEPAGAAWDYYKQAFANGECAFTIDYAYNGEKNMVSFLDDMTDEWGFVMFPKPTDEGDYVNCWEDNFLCIPACYDADRAWKIAFAWDLYTDVVPGYENDESWKERYERFDERAVNETLTMMRQKGTVSCHRLISQIDLGQDLVWNIGPNQAPLDAVVSNASGKWDGYLAETNRSIEQLTTSLGENMFRLYNPNSGEHFYTANAIERGTLTNLGWKYEGIAWNAPSKSNVPVYRLFNPNSGDHHYTTYADERDAVVAAGWIYEGIGWYSEANSGTPLYRLYNPNALTGIHHYTSSAEERTNLINLGWRDEGIGWYGRTR